MTDRNRQTGIISLFGLPIHTVDHAQWGGNRTYMRSNLAWSKEERVGKVVIRPELGNWAQMKVGSRGS